MYPQLVDYREMSEYADEFSILNTTLWTSVDDAGTGTNLVSGSQVSIVSAAADNDYHFAKSAAAVFTMAKGLPINLMAQFSLAEAATNAANWVIGLSSVVDATILGDNGAGPPASFSGAIFYKVDGGAKIAFATSNGTVQTKNTTLADWVSGKVYRLYLHWDSGDGTTAYVTPIVENVTDGLQWIGVKHAVSLTSIAAMSIIYGVKAGSASAETLKMDRLAVCQKR